MKKHGLVCGLCALLLAAFACAGMAEELAANEFLGENPNGAGGTIRVKVTMDGETIKDIKTVEQHETRGLGTTAIMQLTKDILATNNVEVDSITGATLTSTAFKAAVRQAVETALGFDPSKDVQLGENEYLGISENALGGRLMVKVALKDGAIAAIEVLESHESAEIGDVALAQQMEKMIAQNSTEVDSVTGATITSKALAEAVTMALEFAK